MKKLLYILLAVQLLFFSNLTYGQESNQKPPSEMTKEEKKAFKKAEKARLKAEKKQKKEAEKAANKALEEQATLKALASIKDKSFVLETNTIRDRYGKVYNLPSSINFVGRVDDKATVQIGLNGIMGWNGVGGITVTGDITSEEDLFDKEGNLYGQKFRIQSTAGFAEIRIEVSSGNRANAYISTMSSGGQLVFTGIIVPLEDTRVYKGMDLF